FAVMPHPRVTFIWIEEPTESIPYRSASQGVGIARTTVPMWRAIRRRHGYQRSAHFCFAKKCMLRESLIPPGEILEIGIHSSIAKGGRGRALIGLNDCAVFSRMPIGAIPNVVTSFDVGQAVVHPQRSEDPITQEFWK